MGSMLINKNKLFIILTFSNDIHIEYSPYRLNI